MKYSNSIPLVGLSIAVIGILGMSTLSSASPENVLGVSQTSDGHQGKILGHITLIEKDKYGNVISYRQTDNAITNLGKDCAVSQLFGTATATSTCVAAPSTFNIIGLGTTAALDYASTLGTVSEVSGTGLAATTATSQTMTASTANGGSTQNAVVTLTKQFTSATGTTAVSAADLRDSGNNIFAAKTFSAITLNNGDSLTVNWALTFTS